VLGFATGLPLAALRKLMTVVWLGFWTNAISGVMLFSIDAKKDFYSPLFRIKLSAIALGLILGSVISSSVLQGDSPVAATSSRAKVLAVCSLTCWAGAIVTGRLLAYFTYGDIGLD
jgi:hypothetical protein